MRLHHDPPPPDQRDHWFTVLIQTLIVIFGVFIGLQVNNWNKARTD